ncbi:FAD/NAD-P-binding domain-containing protein [Cristinia sonorae]|uniref:FAD/NAD-P-binding domain-containing protein n=1 Tax=Cristinia sonorae TaxID=1940300 RepID=A0A8K0XT55_9AGAR|nr:FAD/NAD-P-binding domain-containing protein [Cristinia sonorae]
MSVVKAEYHNLAAYTSSTLSAARSFDVFTVLSPNRFFLFVFNIFYIVAQGFIVWAFKPKPPRRQEQPTKPLGRVAVIGAGLTGVSSAAHAIAHGFDVVIFEQGEKVGGIWSHVNSTSGLQLNSLLYRFHPGVMWSSAFPLRDEILGEIERVWKEYKLDSRTRFKTRVTSVRRADGSNGDADPNSQGHARWIINDGEDGIFDAVIVTVGTCGKPRMVKFEGMPATKEEKDAGGKDREERNNGEEAWSTAAHESSQAIRADQHRKADAKFPTPGEAYHDDSVQDSITTIDGATSEISSDHEEQKHAQHTAWTGETSKAHVAERHDQDKKKRAGFPTPAEAFPTSPSEDPQKDTKAKSLLDKGDNDEDGESKDTKGEDADVFTKGPVVHSSELDKLSEDHVKGKEVIVIGSGASGVEAVETALAKGAKKAIIIAREDKWIIPRNIVLDTLISAQPFGRQMPLSFLWEQIVALWNYTGVRDLAPKNTGIFEGTPVVNDEFLRHVRRGKCDYIRGDTQRLTSNGVRVNVRGRDSRPGDKGAVKEIHGDVIVLATGYEKPDVEFLGKELFPEGYERPNLYLQNFCTEDWSILMTNSAYMNAIGTVGHFHIGIYTRILLTLLMDKDARPTPKDMKLWVDVIRFIKKGAKGGALGFFTYMELTIWLLLFHVLRLDRLRWVFFIMQGWGETPSEYHH